MGALLNDALGGWRVGLGTTYHLDRTADMAASAVAHISVRAAEQSALDAQRRVTGDVRAAHRAYLRTAQSIAMQTKALDLAERQLQLAEMRYERGLSGNFDASTPRTPRCRHARR